MVTVPLSLINSTISCKDAESVQEVWSFLQQHFQDFDIVLLDEIGLACHYGLIPHSELIELLENRTKSDVVLMGPGLSKAVMDLAEQVTSLKTPSSPMSAVDFSTTAQCQDARRKLAAM
jgi:cob(I)alamin adenosyltransferase